MVLGELADYGLGIGNVIIFTPYIIIQRYAPWTLWNFLLVYIFKICSLSFLDLGLMEILWEGRMKYDHIWVVHHNTKACTLNSMEFSFSSYHWDFSLITFRLCLTINFNSTISFLFYFWLQSCVWCFDNFSIGNLLFLLFKLYHGHHLQNLG